MSLCYQVMYALDGLAGEIETEMNHPKYKAIPEFLFDRFMNLKIGTLIPYFILFDK